MHAANTPLTRPALSRRHLALAVGGLFVGAALLAAPKAVLAWDWGGGPKIVGSGNVTTTTRAVTGFNGIDLSLPGDVKIVQGSTEGVTIETDDNIAPLIETVVERGRLRIRLQNKIGSIHSKQMRVTVNARTLEQLEVSGSGTITADKLQGQQLRTSIAGSGDMRFGELDFNKLSISIAGSGDFVASGKAASLDASIAGSGDIQVQGLSSDNVKISIAGSGSANVTARTNLKISIAGSGDVSFIGDPEVSKTIVGSGSVRRIGAAPASKPSGK